MRSLTNQLDQASPLVFGAPVIRTVRAWRRTRRVTSELSAPATKTPAGEPITSADSASCAGEIDTTRA